MAEDELLEEEEDEELNIPAILIAVVLLLAIIGGVVWFFFIREVPVDKTKLLPWEPPENVAEEKIYDLFPQLIINPVDSRGRFFLILKINILFQDIDILPELLDKPWILPKAQNIVIDIFSTYTMGELRMPKFKEEARQEIKSECQRIAWMDRSGGGPHRGGSPATDKRYLL